MKTINETNNLVSEIELSYVSKIKPSERLQISKSSDCANIFKSINRYSKNLSFCECFYAMYLNRANKVLSVILISEGATAGTGVDIKKILAPAILQNASSIILSHNHPSGQLQASDSDIKINNKIKDSAKLMDISVLDNIIITEESFLSFADEGLM